MKISEHLKNIYLNLYIKRAKISYLSPLKGQYINLITHSFLLYFKISSVDLFKLINTGSVLIVLKNGKDGKIYYEITQYGILIN
ncbi:hypothetical protein YYC_05067 [Plasmodium yoelii 17X]|uniref:Uncharacterized protein n=1 Tax=Plasmodium yoelii 17X TaxID=1323249 RepID=V7PCH9_PLAYE|nr:hypothetical protein YYC_05067 [Plasmodium yoelii 17X]